METRKKRIVKADGDRIEKAIKNIRALTEMTKKYESTLAYRDNIISKLDLLKVWYASHLGYMDSALEFPFTLKEMRIALSDAKMIYTYARKPHAKKDPADSLWEMPLNVLTLAVERAAWLEGKEAIIEK